VKKVEEKIGKKKKEKKRLGNKKKAINLYKVYKVEERNKFYF